MRPHPCVRNRGEDEVVELKIKINGIRLKKHGV